MGMYTELVLKVQVKEDLPADVEAVFQYLFNREGELPTTIKHPFFECSRKEHIGSCSSYYHCPFALSRYAEGYISSRSDLKDYSDEIAKFVDWAKPYFDVMPGCCFGWSWYEEADQPTLLIA